MMTLQLYMEISRLLDRLTGLEPEMALELSLGSATMYCLNADFMIIYGVDSLTELTPLEVRFVKYGYKVERKVLLQIYLCKYGCN